MTYVYICTQLSRMHPGFPQYGYDCTAIPYNVFTVSKNLTWRIVLMKLPLGH